MTRPSQREMVGASPEPRSVPAAGRSACWCSRSLPRGRREAEREEALDTRRAADWIGSNETQFGEQVGMIAVAAAAAYEGLPVVVQGFDAPSWWPQLAEGDDRGEMLLD